MTWHWSYKTLPELAGLPDDEKRRVWVIVRRRAQRHPAAWVLLVGATAGVLGLPQFVVLPLVLPLLRGAGLLPMLAAGPIVGCTVGYGLVALAMQGVYHAARPYILRELPGRCRGCGYDLTGNASGACPECGRAAGPDAQGSPGSGRCCGAAQVTVRGGLGGSLARSGVRVILRVRKGIVVVPFKEALRADADYADPAVGFSAVACRPRTFIPTISTARRDSTC